MSAIAEITAESFEQQILRSECPVLVAVCAQGSHTSQRLLTLLETWMPEPCGWIKVVWVNATKSPEIRQRCGVLSTPGVALFSQGEVWYQFTGEPSRRELDDLLAQTALLTQTPASS